MDFVSIIRSTICDVCGFSDVLEGQNWSRPPGWGGLTLEIRPTTGASAETKKMDVCPACVDAFAVWDGQRVELTNEDVKRALEGDF